MAFPSKVRLRKITVDGVVYRWRFGAGEMKGTLYIYGLSSGGTALHVHSEDWFDLWLSWPFANPKSSVLVTPVLVRHLILWALENDWKPLDRAAPMVLNWSDDEKRWRRMGE